MDLAAGQIVEGKVTGITGFGAFVDLGGGKTGMVHISEISTAYVTDIHDHLSVGDTVKVKVMNVGDDGKIALSVRRALEPQRPQGQFRSGKPQGGQGFRGSRPPQGKPSGAKPPQSRPQHSAPPAHKPAAPQQETIPGYEATVQKSGSPAFEEMMSRFKQNSEDKISDLKRKNSDMRRAKRGGMPR